jgi:NAD+ synthetase
MDYIKLTKNIREELRTYIAKHGLKSLVLGISGGIDSAVCAALAKPVCDELGIPLIGRSLPIETNKQEEIDRAKIVGECFCHDFKEVSFNKIYQMFDEKIQIVEGTENTKIAKGNIKARIRMIYLYNIAGMNNGMVLSTDNYTEFLLSFFTIHGDHNDYGMIQFLWKTEVYGLAQHLVNELENDKAKESIRACIVAKATDGLGISESDVEQFGVDSYEEVDFILKDYVINGNEKYCNHPVIRRYENTHFKRNWPITIPRSKLQ